MVSAWSQEHRLVLGQSFRRSIRQKTRRAATHFQYMLSVLAAAVSN